MSYNPVKWETCPFYRWGSKYERRSPARLQAQADLAEACALEPEDTFCPWPADTGYVEDTVT